MDELQRLCVGAKPLRAGAQRDLEAELLKARVLARVSSDQPSVLDYPRLGRFDVLRWLGRGGMGSVFEARDRAHGQCLALKVLHEPDLQGLARLRREFRSLADISHAGLVTLGELYEESGLPFFTMELVPGQSLQQLIDDRASCENGVLEHWMAQLIAALSALHARGVAHGDIKPSNLMVRPDGHLVVVDFGVAHVLSEVAELRGSRGSGTLAYMAPERVRGGHASPQADWYAVGAVLRELLEIAPSEALRRVVPGLLEASPQRRFGGAELARAIGMTLRVPVGLVSEDDGVFVGRERELSALVGALTQRGPYLCRVRGEPGIGKTALLEQFAVAAAAQGALLLSGRCYEHENTRFKGFDVVIEGLARHLLTLPSPERKRLPPAELDALLQVFPALTRAAVHPATDNPSSNKRAISKLARDQDTLSSAEREQLPSAEIDAHAQELPGVARAQLGRAADGLSSDMRTIRKHARDEGTLPSAEREQLAPPKLDALAHALPGVARVQLGRAAHEPGSATDASRKLARGQGTVSSAERDRLAPPERDAHVRALPGVARTQLGRTAVEPGSDMRAIRTLARDQGTLSSAECEQLAPPERDAHVRALPGVARTQYGRAEHEPGSASDANRRLARDEGTLPLAERERLAPPELDVHAQELPGVACVQLGRAGGGTSVPPLADLVGVERLVIETRIGRSLELTRTIRQLAFAGLVSLLRLVAAQRPLVIGLDDWQWADADGAQLLEQLMAAGIPCLFVISQREGHSVAGRAAQLDLELSPMSDEDATQLVHVLSANTRPEARAALAREAGGSPLVLRALLRARPPGGQLRDYNALVGEVVSELDDDARALLRLSALAGQPVSMELLASAAQLPARPWQAVARLKNLRMLRSAARAGSPALAPHHDRVREAVSGALDDEARRAGHAALAHAAEQLGFANEAPEFAAEQHLRAGQLPRAAFYAELAGDRARASAALEQARMQYSRALDAHAPARPAQLVAKLADACALVGDVQRAAPLLLEAAACLPEQAQALQLQAAEMFLLAGQAARGMELLCPLLRAQGVWLPVSEYAAGLLGALSLVRLQLSRGHEPAAVPDPRIETTFRLGFLFQLTQPMHGYRLLLWSTERALHHGTAPQRARALAQLAVTQKALGLGTLAAQDALLEQALAATSSDAVERTFVFACKILVAFAQCDCPATLACAEQTRRFVLQHRVPVDWILGPITAVEVSTRVLAGQFAALRASRLEVERESRALGNRALSVQMDAAHAWAELAHGNPDDMRAFSERALREWVGSQPLYALAMWGEAHRRLYCGDLAGAAELMRVEQPRYARAGISRVQSWSLALTLLWGTIALRLSNAPNDAHARAARRYLRALRKARESCAAPSAALLEAGIYRRERDQAAACAAYKRARQGFAALGMSGYAAAAAYRIAELQNDRTDPAHAAPWFAQQEIANPAAWTNMYAP